MKAILLLCVLAVGARGAIGELRVTTTSTWNDILRVSTPEGIVPLQARELHVKVRYPSGKEGAVELFVFYEPQSHLYLWSYQFSEVPEVADPMERYCSSVALSIADGRMTLFSMGSDLFIRQFSQKASSLDDAQQRTLVDATTRLSNMKRETDDFHPLRWVEIGKQLSRDFYFAPDQVAPPLERPRVLQSSYSDGAWQVILQGQWKARVTLTKNYDLVKVERID
jgi:hypothetical protein